MPCKQHLGFYPKLLCFLLLFFVVNMTMAQQPKGGSIELFVYDTLQRPLEGATANLFSKQDNIPVKASLATKEGLLRFERLSAGRFYVALSMVGYTSFRTNEFDLRGDSVLRLSDIVLREATSLALSQVVVTARKPFIQKLADRTVVNVENSIMATGGSALDVLERTPGITVDASEGINITGKNGVAIFIDGKPVPLSGAELASLLRGYSSSIIDRIEVITNPSSRYEAAGISGIIDIRLKKDQRFGTNGNFSASAGYGKFPKAVGSLNLNYRKKNINLYGSYYYSYRKGQTNLYQQKAFLEDGKSIGGYDLYNDVRFPFKNHSLRIGADVSTSSNSVFGVVVSGNLLYNARTNDNLTNVLNESKAVIAKNRSYANTHVTGWNGLVNFNYKTKLNKSGAELNADIDFGTFQETPLSDLTTTSFDLGGSVIGSPYLLVGDQAGKVKLASCKIDYAFPLNGFGKIEVGAKLSNVSTDNKVVFTNRSGSVPMLDTSRSNHFLYTENTKAGYVNLVKTFKKASIASGLRLERTFYTGNQVTKGEKFDSVYWRVFPNITFNYQMSDKQSVSFSVKQRIERPTFNQLNPFRYFLDSTTYNVGNPYLRPQIAMVYELGLAAKPVGLALSYSNIKNYFMTIVAPVGDSQKTSFQTPTNFKRYSNLNTTLTAPLYLAKWWQTTANVVASYYRYEGFNAGTKLDATQFQLDATLNNTFKLPKGLTMELNGAYVSSVRFGFMTGKPLWHLSAGIEKAFSSNKGNVRLTVTDIFKTNVRKGLHLYDNYSEFWISRRETRIAMLSFTYRFGSSSVRGARKRATASEEERRRAGE